MRVLTYPYLGDYDDVGQDLDFRSTTAPSDESDAAKQETKFKHTDPAGEITLNNMNVFLAAGKFAISPLKSTQISLRTQVSGMGSRKCQFPRSPQSRSRRDGKGRRPS